MFALRLAIGALVSGLTFTTARAAVVSGSPTLPLLGVAFSASGTGNCFPAAGVCAAPGALTFTSVVPSPPAPPAFNASGQDIVVNATLTGELTDLSHQPIGPLSLSGTVEMEIEGRTFSTETGSWSIALLAIDLEGPVLGHTLSISLDSSAPSTGTASIEPEGNQFLIDSVFDVVADLSLDTAVPLETVVRAHFAIAGSGVAVPEPATVTLLAGAAIGVVALRRRRRGEPWRGLGISRQNQLIKADQAA